MFVKGVSRTKCVIPVPRLAIMRYDYCVPEIVSDVTTCVAFAGGIPSLRPVIFDVSSLIILPGLGGGKGKMTKYPFFTEV